MRSLTPTQQRVLLQLELKPVLHRQLAEDLEIHRSAVTRALHGLAELKVVDQDGRKGVCLTTRGERARHLLVSLGLLLDDLTCSGKRCLECGWRLSVADLEAPACPHCRVEARP